MNTVHNTNAVASATTIPLLLAFRTRSKLQSGMVTLYARLSIGSVRSSEFKLDVLVPVEAWHKKLHRVDPDHPQAEAINDQLDELVREYESIYREQTESTDINDLPFFVTVNTVIQQWKTKRSVTSPLLLSEVFTEFMYHLRQLPRDERKAPKTMQCYIQAGKYLNDYLRHSKQPALPADYVTGGWGRRFHDWLRAKGISAGTATRYFMVIKSAMQHAYYYDRVKANPLETVHFKGDRRKPIHYLDVKHLEQLARLNLEGTINDARNWALLMCYTALDYKDALAVVKSLNKYRVDTMDGPKLVYQRLKYAHAPQWGECHIPLLERAIELLSVAPTWKRPRHRNQNNFLNKIGVMLKLPFPFTTKVCRKTAGIMFLREGFDIYGVQKIMGHQSVKVTEGHYCNLPEEVVNRQMREVASRRSQSVSVPVPHTPFQRFG